MSPEAPVFEMNIRNNYDQHSNTFSNSSGNQPAVINSPYDQSLTTSYPLAPPPIGPPLKSYNYHLAPPVQNQYSATKTTNTVYQSFSGPPQNNSYATGTSGAPLVTTTTVVNKVGNHVSSISNSVNQPSSTVTKPVCSAQEGLRVNFNTMWSQVEDLCKENEDLKQRLELAENELAALRNSSTLMSRLQNLEKRNQQLEIQARKNPVSCAITVSTSASGGSDASSTISDDKQRHQLERELDDLMSSAGSTAPPPGLGSEKKSPNNMWCASPSLSRNSCASPKSEHSNGPPPNLLNMLFNTYDTSNMWSETAWKKKTSITHHTDLVSESIGSINFDPANMDFSDFLSSRKTSEEMFGSQEIFGESVILKRQRTEDEIDAQEIDDALSSDNNLMARGQDNQANVDNPFDKITSLTVTKTSQNIEVLPGNKTQDNLNCVLRIDDRLPFNKTIPINELRKDGASELVSSTSSSQCLSKDLTISTGTSSSISSSAEISRPSNLSVNSGKTQSGASTCLLPPNSVWGAGGSSTLLKASTNLHVSKSTIPFPPSGAQKNLSNGSVNKPPNSSNASASLNTSNYISSNVTNTSISKENSSKAVVAPKIEFESSWTTVAQKNVAQKKRATPIQGISRDGDRERYAQRVGQTPEELDKTREKMIELCDKHEVDDRTVIWFMEVRNLEFWPLLLEKILELDRRANSGDRVKNPSAWLTRYFNTLVKEGPHSPHSFHRKYNNY